MSRIAHGTTAATNASIERRGAKTALLTTRGFEDTIFMQRQMGMTAGLSSNELTDSSLRQVPAPLAPRSLVFGVRERIDYRGAVIGGRGTLLFQADLTHWEEIERMTEAAPAALGQIDGLVTTSATWRRSSIAGGDQRGGARSRARGRHQGHNSDPARDRGPDARRRLRSDQQRLFDRAQRAPSAPARKV